MRLGMFLFYIIKETPERQLGLSGVMHLGIIPSHGSRDILHVQQ